MWSNLKKQKKQNVHIPARLLWDVNMEHFDMQKGRALVAQRVAERGDLEDFYTMFSLYGGVKGVREIYRSEVRELNPRALAFISAAFNLKKEEMKCYTRKRSKAIPWDY
jgi:hypothetical protein